MRRWVSIWFCFMGFVAACARDTKSATTVDESDVMVTDAGANPARDGALTPLVDADVLADGAALPPVGPAPEDETWVDATSGLEWDNRAQANTMEVDVATAKRQCDELSLGSHDDWRLPNIDELRSLVRNISPVMTGGACPTSEACPGSGKCNIPAEACIGCTAMDPALFVATDCKLDEADLAAGLCYWPRGINGPCSAYWSSTANPDLFGQASYYLRFSNGIIRSDFAAGGGHWVRCVRTAG